MNRPAPTFALATGLLVAAGALAEPAAAQSALGNGIDAVGATTETVADHVAIAEVTNLFENALDEGDIDAHMATWASDALSFASPFGNYDSHADYREWVSGFHEQMSSMGGTRHLITNAVVEVDGDRATQTAYLLVLGRTMNDGSPGMMATVRLEDELARTADGWRFTSRELNLDQDPALFGGG